MSHKYFCDMCEQEKPCHELTEIRIKSPQSEAMFCDVCPKCKRKLLAPIKDFTSVMEYQFVTEED